MTATPSASPRRPLVSSPVFLHLSALSDDLGLFEHAEGDSPRREHGYCVDDVARGLLVVARERRQTAELAELAEVYLRFVEAAIDPEGRSHNRRDVEGRWTDQPGLGDWWGRSLWGLGVAAVSAPRALTRKRALRAFLTLATQRSSNPRTMVFAALGAGELVLAGNTDERVISLLTDALDSIPVANALWEWPEESMRYGNGSLAEALILGGAALGDTTILDRGLSALGFLIEVESRDGHLSVTGTAGRSWCDTAVQFDQQPIELAAIADAAARAFDITGDRQWLDVVQQAWAWFLGDNDGSMAMVDAATGAGFDGLMPDGRNDNRGAESTLAAIATHQQALRLSVA